MIQFLSGAILMASFVCCLFFFRGWRQSGDPLLLLFGIAFALFTFERVALASLREFNESVPEIYLMRLAAFVIIIVAILRKNIQSSGSASHGTPP